MAAISGQDNFREAGNSIVIPLTGAITTKTLFVGTITGNWAIQFVNITGLSGGTPTYTLKSSMTETVADFREYEPEFTSNINIDLGVKGDSPFPMQYFLIEIKMNGNTSGSCEILIGGV